MVADRVFFFFIGSGRDHRIIMPCDFAGVYVRGTQPMPGCVFGHRRHGCHQHMLVGHSRNGSSPDWLLQRPIRSCPLLVDTRSLAARTAEIGGQPIMPHSSDSVQRFRGGRGALVSGSDLYSTDICHNARPAPPPGFRSWTTYRQRHRALPDLHFYSVDAQFRYANIDIPNRSGKGTLAGH